MVYFRITEGICFYAHFDVYFAQEDSYYLWKCDYNMIYVKNWAPLEASVFASLYKLKYLFLLEESFVKIRKHSNVHFFLYGIFIQIVDN